MPKKKGYPKDEFSIFLVKPGETLKEAHKKRGSRGITLFGAKDKKALLKKHRKIMKDAKGK